MDLTIRQMVKNYDPVELAKNKDWYSWKLKLFMIYLMNILFRIELVELYTAMKKMLPKDYLASMAAKPPMKISKKHRNLFA